MYISSCGAATYEYDNSSEPEERYLSVRRPHKRPVEYEPGTSSDCEDEGQDDEGSGHGEFTGSGSDGRKIDREEVSDRDTELSN